MTGQDPAPDQQDPQPDGDDRPTLEELHRRAEELAERIRRHTAGDATAGDATP
ncbi:hypothetical protein RKE29_19830 [Streptomyces sp. B1866]|uniref:hypothetical protein n=1 Tax=Streptomyces sp. B1866 TaxID=3075431 RepID=UPI00288D9120|nr:hypothetical protein [Streptomyces sp. B1866]MDT3398871.1 hypothetical protein [Streptomyces sp. B1866]